MNQRYYSNIYWHFTGSPTDLDGTLLTKPADISRYGNLKSVDEAADILVEILRSRTLLATSVEMISETLATEAFCCLTDIPLKDLPLHARHYGKVAVGFRAAAIQNRFVPVMYLSKDNLAMKQRLIPNKRNGAGAAANASCEAPAIHFDAHEHLQQTHGYRIQRERGGVATAPRTSEVNPFLNYVKITDFGVSTDMSFYSEREWRHVGDFSFNTNDIEAVIAPAEKLPCLRRRLFRELGYPETLLLISWEFLEQA